MLFRIIVIRYFLSFSQIELNFKQHLLFRQDPTRIMQPLPESGNLSCDYLVIGAGTSSLSFVDTLLDELPDATFVLVDRFSRPGGHWTTAYPFVRLHQPSCNYGVNSRQLGKTKTKGGAEAFDFGDRATSEEICDYYAKVVERFKETKRVKVYFNANYVWNEDVQAHEIVSVTDLTESKFSYTVKYSKLVTCETNVTVPSMRDAPYFPTDDSVPQHFVPINTLSEKVKDETYKKFVVIGAGKTGTDAIIHLLRQGVDESDIIWIISRDIWYMLSDGVWPKRVPGKKYYAELGKAMFKPLQDAKNADEFFLNGEQVGCLGRLDPNGPLPEVYHGAIIDKSELETIREVKNVVRLGRVTSISSNDIVLEGGTVPFVPGETLFVDCTAQEFYGYYNFDQDFEFFNEDKIRLGPLPILFNPSMTSTLIAYLEAKISDDYVKNNLIYFVKGDNKNGLDSKEIFLVNLYNQMKTLDRITKAYMPAALFVLKSRTNGDAPMHHGGLIPLLWAMLGPMKLKKTTDATIKKFEKGGYSVDVSMPDRTHVGRHSVKGALRVSTKKGLCSSV